MDCPRCGGFCERLSGLVDLSEVYGFKIFKVTVYQCNDCLGKYLIDGSVAK